MTNYESAGKGLWKLFISYVGIFVCQIFRIIPMLNLVAAVVVVAFAVYGLIGLGQAGKNIVGCRVALILEVVKAALIVLASVNTFVLYFGSASTIESWKAMVLYTIAAYASLISIVLSLVIVLVIILSVTSVLKTTDNIALAKRGYLIAGIVAGLEIISFIIRLLNEINGYTAGGYTALSFVFVALIATVILPLVSFILQIDFVSRSADVFGH